MDEFDFSTCKVKIDTIKKIKLAFLSCLYCFFIVLVSLVNRKQISVTISGTIFSPSVISGVITSISVGIGIMMTQVHWHYGGILCYFFFSISFLLCLISIFVSIHPESIPGIFFLFSGFLINFVLIKNLRTIATKNLIVKKASVTDSITGLLNHRGINRAINLLIEKGKPFYILFLDMDNFKSLNDTYGHSAGDFFLTCMGKRWNSIPKPEGQIARNGGDEYIIVIPADKPFDIEEYAKECVKKAAEPVELPNNKGNFKSSASVGIAKYPDNGTTIDQVMSKADSAMYESKHKGKNCYTFC